MCMKFMETHGIVSLFYLVTVRSRPSHLKLSPGVFLFICLVQRSVCFRLSGSLTRWAANWPSSYGNWPSRFLTSFLLLDSHSRSTFVVTLASGTSGNVPRLFCLLSAGGLSGAGCQGGSGGWRAEEGSAGLRHHAGEVRTHANTNMWWRDVTEDKQELLADVFNSVCFTFWKVNCRFLGRENWNSQVFY